MNLIPWSRRGLAVAALTLFAAMTAGAQAQILTVSAAVSLSESFKDLAKVFEAQNPGATVQLNFGGSGALLQQILRGAPVDVLATADEATMDRAQQHQVVRAADRHVFAQNSLVAIVPVGARSAVSSLADLRTMQRVALGNPDSVPAGRYASEAVARAGLGDVLLERRILAQNVRQVLDYVARDEVDLGFVYGTDAALMPDKVKVAFTVALPTPVRYPIAVVQASPEARVAQRFVDLVLSPRGQALLARHGLRPAAPR
ncbi:molybdate ABC transporter substrate-binding protein [Comamonas serinivorans]|uniref:Molybdate ABC transporter substrate-binding protein n=1 Tax=Comamonas serinivorans TaxID=1082851 RepID=A0A1Y0EK07_9BURK|nr:molybdate ABC transporter substrate-binding protein [Comamonas serinivorans]ARU03699.1 molybdate ABC transporter substrate-binding protein [Comamonas serinivorans]